MPSRRPTVALAGPILVAILLSLTAVALVAAAPPPSPLCGVCGPNVIDGAIDPGTLDVHVDENGDSRWIARVPVNETAAETYRADGGELESVVEDRWDRYDAVGDDAQSVETSIEDRTVRVEYAVPAVASSVGDGWVLEYFYAGGTPQRYELVAERVSIHLPDGYAATNSPSGAAVEDETLTWTAGDGDGGGGDFHSLTYVTYGPSGLAGTVASWSAAAVAFGPLVIEHTALAGIVPVAILGIAAVSTGRFGAGRFGDPFGVGRRIGVGGRTVLRALCDRVGLALSRRTLVLLAVGSAVALAAGSWLAFSPFEAVFVGSFGLASALFLPLGHALDRGDRSSWGYGALVVLSPLLAAAALAPYPAPSTVLIVTLLLFLPWAVGAGILGYVLSLIGRQVAAG